MSQAQAPEPAIPATIVRAAYLLYAAWHCQDAENSLHLSVREPKVARASNAMGPEALVNAPGSGKVCR